MGGLEDQNPAFLHERAQPRRLPVYNAYMKPVGYIKNYKQTFHLTHNGSIRGECWPLPFAQIWPQTKGKKKHPANISVQCKCSWRQRQETRTWLINMSTRSNGVKLQSGAISVPPCPTRVPMRRCRHDESEATHCPPAPRRNHTNSSRWIDSLDDRRSASPFPSPGSCCRRWRRYKCGPPPAAERCWRRSRSSP